MASGADCDADQHLKGAAMEELNARAVLVQAPDVGEGITTSVPREEIQRALDVEDAPPELILDLTRLSDGHPTDTRSIAVAWERKDLQDFLRETSGEQVILTFDRETLGQAMDADVEAHGLREKVLVLAVAATAATGAASSAAAMPAFYEPGGPTVQSTLGPDDRAVSRATPAPEASLGVDDRAVSRATPAPEPVLGADDRAVSRATPAPEPVLGADDRAVSRSTPAPEPVLGADDRAVSRATPTPEPGIGVDDRAVSRATSDFASPEPGAGSDVISWPDPAATAAIGGAIALAITGAAFVAGRRRRTDIRPA
jgi:hypothetical protein